jgi:hypothetical protein
MLGWPAFSAAPLDPMHTSWPLAPRSVNPLTISVAYVNDKLDLWGPQIF